MDKAVIKAKKVECIVGLFFLLPPVLGVFAICTIGIILVGYFFNAISYLLI